MFKQMTKLQKSIQHYTTEETENRPKEKCHSLQNEGIGTDNYYYC